MIETYGDIVVANEETDVNATVCRVVESADAVKEIVRQRNGFFFADRTMKTTISLSKIAVDLDRFIRLPSKTFPQIDALCALMKKVLSKYPEIEKRTAFVRYPRSDEITAEFCKHADARMIWGGDKTIASVKACPASPRCVDSAFADRYSLAIIDGKAGKPDRL